MLGILSGIFDVDPHAWEDIVLQLSENDGLITYYANIVNSGKATPQQLGLLVELTEKNRIMPISLTTFAYGKPLDHLSTDTVSQFALKLSAASGAVAWAALDILFMYCFGVGERWEQCRATFREIVVKVPLSKTQGLQQMDMHLWHQVIEKLLATEDERFAKVISQIIIDSSDKMDFGDIWHYAQPLIRKVFQLYGRSVWPLFSAAIKNAEPVERYRLTQLLGSSDLFNKKSPSVLAELPDDLLQQWCFNEPDIAPEFVAEATEVLLNTEDGVALSPRARFLLDHFGDDKRVVSALSANLGSFGWSGSAVPHYQGEAKALEILTTHEKENVKEWARHRLAYLAKLIDREKRRDEEHDWGIF